MKKLTTVLLGGAVLVAAGSVQAATGSTVTDITDAATSVFATVAGICVTIGVFMIGYRLARKIR
jgi:hypothetical protein